MSKISGFWLGMVLSLFAMVGCYMTSLSVEINGKLMNASFEQNYHLAYNETEKAAKDKLSVDMWTKKYLALAKLHMVLQFLSIACCVFGFVFQSWRFAKGRVKNRRKQSHIPIDQGAAILRYHAWAASSFTISVVFIFVPSLGKLLAVITFALMLLVLVFPVVINRNRKGIEEAEAMLPARRRRLARLKARDKA